MTTSLNEPAVEQLDENVVERDARGASASAPTAAAVRRSLDEPTMWGESEDA